MKKLYYSLVFTLALISILLAILDITNIINIAHYPFVIVDRVILLFFWIDYVVRFTKAQNKWTFVKANIFDLIAIIPFDSLFAVFRIARTVRLLKLLKLVRIAGFTKRIQHNFKKFINTNGFIYLVITALIIILLGAGIYSVAENANYTDALWWAIATTTTVGYGDISPHTEIGKAVAVVLMIVGIGLIGSITSTITSFFVNSENDDTLTQINERLVKIENMLNKQTPQNHDSCTTSYNELLQLKQLLNDGVITKEDFESKKNQILGV
ncbi:ion channel [Convivina intestini]|uniref:ion channel n=1 Tax=Convivina intestini TaxID=1505726 RepID=UPI00200D764F|nr:ion channel [Convivina intestini]CAH1852485.1 hypothetical protein R078131_00486 [Convivina intestini]